MAQAVESAIERPLVTFILRARHSDPDAMLAGIAPNPPATVALVPNDAVRAALGTAWPPPLDGTALQELLEDHRLMALPRCEDDSQQLAAPFGAQVDCGTETAPAPAEGFGLWVPFFAPAACWWARSIVPSLEGMSQFSWPAASACACTAAKS
jgi:hypothetical protein